ncbi:type 1 fimbrial protein [Pseudomonas fakonensis]|uniref:Type 1 fimbrial protein n=1 Tax=Pseudomonas fakonensis TaxID=2842355 RepID=A0ABX8NAF7_9PSED|nr:fimbrial protein [Pseudomonas fakonensis]QXH52979.1 type 1 fimbrial protein [Pseudomonas fakonensis]
MPTLKRLYTAISLLTLAGTAHAIPECTWDTTPGPLRYNIDLGETWVARDAPVGSMIGTIRTLPATELQGRGIRCDNDGSATLSFQASASAPLHPNPLPPVNGWDVNGKVIETGIPGVGLYVRLGFPFTGGASNAFTPVDDVGIPYQGEHSRDAGATPIEIRTLFASYTLIKTGTIPPGPQSFGKQIAHSQISNLGSALDIHVSGGVHQAQCTLKADAVSADPVQLGSHDLADFSGVGSTTQATDFHITLSDCEDNPAGSIARAFIRLEGARGSVPLLPGIGVFGLSSNSSASGIAIQLLRSDNSPMPLQQDEPVTPLVIGITRLDFKARYYQMDPRITPGLAEGALDFTISYR